MEADWLHGSEVSQKLFSCLDCITEWILRRADVTSAGGDSSGSASTGYVRRTYWDEIHVGEIS